MADAEAEINVLVEKLAKIASRDYQTCFKTIDAVHALQLKLEEPDQFFQRTNHSYVEIVVTKVADDLQIYRRLAEHATPVHVTQLAAESGATPPLMCRLLRFLAGAGHIKETGQGMYAANDLTNALARHQGIINLLAKIYKPAIDTLPGMLFENGYQEITDIHKTPIQKAFGTDLSFFEYMHADPNRAELFNGLQKANEAAVRIQWFDVFPVEQEVGCFAGPRVFVDVGSGHGQRSVKLLSAFPQLKGKIVMQDLPQTIAELPRPLEGIQAMPHDFFQEQPVKGAKFYYLRHILHDWPDNEAIEILKRLKEACQPGSQILIDEIVLPNVGAHRIACSLDILMMILFGARERTHDDWKALIEAAGLRVQNVYPYSTRRQDSIIQVVI